MRCTQPPAHGFTANKSSATNDNMAAVRTLPDEVATRPLFSVSNAATTHGLLRMLDWPLNKVSFSFEDPLGPGSQSGGVLKTLEPRFP